MAKTNTVTTKYQHRSLEKLNLMDDFLFQELLSQEGDGKEFCRILLSTILGKTIRQVRIIPKKNILGIDTNRHGIRMDAYIENISDENSIPGIETIDARVTPDMLKYIENTTEENVTNQDIDTIHQFVKKVKHRREVGISYMKSWELERIYREEGRQESIKEGRQQGASALIKTCQEFQITRNDTLAN